jgi:transposase
VSVKVKLDQDTDFLFAPVPLEMFQSLTKEQLIQYVHGLQDLNRQLVSHNKDLKRRAEELEDRSVLLGEQFVVLKHQVYGKSSEKMAASEADVGEDLEAAVTEAPAPKKPPRKKVRLPSLRYPNAPLIERDVTLQDMPACRCCSELLSDSGMTEDREFITKIPAQFYVVREKRHKYRCARCHGDLQTAPALPQIKPGSAFSDDFILDVAVSKFCDLIPIERQVRMAERLGFPGLPPQSLIETTHYLAEFLSPVYEKIKAETMACRVLHADETPHRMLEGDPKSHWYFWGFSGLKSAYFEAHPTRSGDVASSLLKTASCEVLTSDVYSGYKKAARDANEFRAKGKRPLIQTSYCNAHARRKFKEADNFPNERDYFLRQYQRIYRLESEARDPEKPPETLLDRLQENRVKMRPVFEEMKAQALAWCAEFSSKSSIVRAISYFLNNYDELTLFTTPDQLDVAIDNNVQERLLRSPVIGRKTWYGTHSKQGARTTAILFSIMESCKLVGVNPRDYLKAITGQLHASQPAFTPSQFKAH